MFFGKKEDKSRLPDLPSSPIPLNVKTSGLPIKDEFSGSLPAFPDSPMQKGFSQVAIKDAVSDGQEEFVGLPPKDAGVVEMEEWSPDNDIDEELPRRELPLPPRFESPSRFAQPRRAESQDIFVRIDKFHSARKSLDEIKDKLQEVDSFVRKIREIKLREEQELSSWEKDIMHIKSRVQSVSENIFEKVE